MNLEELLQVDGDKRKAAIKEQTDYELTTKMAAVVKSAESIDDLLIALESRIARGATPQPVSSGTMLLVPSDERRRSGSHYTPRSLTEPIVRTTLEPILRQLGEQAGGDPSTNPDAPIPTPTPNAILDLKICDPAMGSGAFLVEACRQLAEALVDSWAAHGYKPYILPDEDELLHARRLVAQRCLYGVDRNPMAVDLAKLSLWLATLAKDHPFTFVDHTLRCGDSLVGLTRKQIVGFDLNPSAQLGFVEKEVRDRMNSVANQRKMILDAGDNMLPGMKLAKLKLADEALSLVRLAGDAVVAAFFAADKPKQRKEIQTRHFESLEQWIQKSDFNARKELQKVIKGLTSNSANTPSVLPFHWEIEFPEVFTRDNPGFDSIVGNPPFAGKNTLINGNREYYLDWLQQLHAESHGNADLVAHFFRASYERIRHGGTFGLIATNTIGQGDTRYTGLRWICEHGGEVYSARRRFKWPGLAAVVVSVVNVLKGEYFGPRMLDGKSVDTITAFLFHAGGHSDPNILLSNDGKSFIGSYLLGMGFTFDDTATQASANPLSLMRELIARDSRNAERIFPYIGGEEVNDSPTHEPTRFVINFVDWPLTRETLNESWADADQEIRAKWLREGVVPDDYPFPVAADYPDLLNVIKDKVKPERDAQKDEYGRRRWWHFLRPRPELNAAISGMTRVLACSRIGNAFAFTFMPSQIVLNEKIVVFPYDTYAPFAVIQCRIHEIWTRFFSSTLKDDLQYTPSVCFETFPFPADFNSSSDIEDIGREYFKSRARRMVESGEGLTKTYNRFHDPHEQSTDILHLRELHMLMDKSVLKAYGWDDLAETARCEFLLDFLDDDEDSEDSSPRRRKKPWRLRWPEEFRDEVLARLLELNEQRAAEERRSGATAKAPLRREDPARRRQLRRSPKPTPLLDRDGR